MMNRRELLSGAAAGVLLFSGMSPALAAADTDADPSAWVIGLTNSLIEDVRKDPALSKADPASVQKFVSSRLMPVADFPRMTRTAVGPQWRTATDEQKKELQEGFRSLLTRVYSGAFTSVKDYRAELVPSRAQASDTPIVKAKLVSKTEQPVQIDYRLKQTDGHWKIIDLNVAGIWMVQNYRSQFGSVLANGGIPALIRTMNDRSSSLNKQPKAN